MAVDPQVAQEVERHRALRGEVGSAFAGVLDEPVPDRLLRAANKAPANAGAQPRRRWSWPEWTSIAASLLIGILAGRAILQPQSESRLVAAGSDGRVIAGGALAQALSEQLS
jgi:anti-sigma factor RsiW